METRRHLTSSLFALIGSVALAALPAVPALAGCSGSNGPGLFQNGGPDAGFEGSGDAANLSQDAASLLTDANLPPCPPAPVTSFKPAWKPPSTAKSGACTTLQMSTFFDACLGPSSNAAGCTAYAQANTDCAACLQSDDTAPQYGPVVWHSSRLYYTTNIAGCIADVQTDGGSAGCGAAYQAVVQCKETACSACLSAQTPDFSRYSACENKAGTECASYIQTLTSTCGTSLKDPANPIAVCIPPAGDTAQDAYLRLAPVFCGK
jgi:hypothetical protein